MGDYFKKEYDVIIIGASLAGLSAALTLLKEGYDVLVLEQHNLPGGVATSFVRGGVEFEASLHEMLSIGPNDHLLKVGRYLKDFNINIDWVRIPESFRYISPSIDVVIRGGEKGDFSKPIEDIANACHDKDGSISKNLKDFFSLCLKIHDSADAISGNRINKLKLIFKHYDFVRTIGYSFLDVAKAYHLPPLAIEILSAYWMYLGSPAKDLPFSVYGYLLADYIGYGAYIPKHTSHEMSLKMLEKVYELKGQVEFYQQVDKILVKDQKVQGVRLASGKEIKAKYVISGAYPNTAYSKMIEPKEEIPPQTIKTINAMEVGVSCFSLVLLLDKDYREFGIKDYATFYAPNGLDTDKIFEKGNDAIDWDFFCTICTNVVYEDASPKGTCIYTMTFLPKGESFEKMDPKQYEEYKNKIVDHFLKTEGNRLGIDFKKHILEMIVETPITISHYTGAYMGGIYGYRHKMDNHVAAREEMYKKEHLIHGLTFAGAHQPGGDGMSPAISNGRNAAKFITSLDRKGGK